MLHPWQIISPLHSIRDKRIPSLLLEEDNNRAHIHLRVCGSTVENDVCTTSVIAAAAAAATATSAGVSYSFEAARVV